MVSGLATALSPLLWAPNGPSNAPHGLAPLPRYHCFPWHSQLIPRYMHAIVCGYQTGCVKKSFILNTRSLAVSSRQMSFNVNWNTLETEQLRDYTRDLLTLALNLGKRPKILAAPIQIKDLQFGKAAPQFEILEIGELDQDRFRGIFKVNYAGDFELTLHTKVQANPLNIHNANSLEHEMLTQEDHRRFVTPNFGVAQAPFPVPLDLKLLNIGISGIGIIVFSKTKGLTLVFRNDPLDLITVTLTFDNVQVLANFLQQQIENQIRDLFRETLPTLIHQLSLKFLNLDTLNRDLLAPTATPTALLVQVPLQPQICSATTQKMAELYQQRQTFSLEVPRIRNVIQRSHLERYAHPPNLLHLLITDYDTSLPVATGPQYNGIPIDFLMHDYDKTGDILLAISLVQATSYYQQKEMAKPKRRRIRLGKKKLGPDANSTMEVETPATEMLALELVEEPLAQPRPLRISKELYHDLLHPLDDHPHHHYLDLPSIVLGVGIGNNYFNFTARLALPMVDVKEKEVSVSPRSSHAVPLAQEIKQAIASVPRVAESTKLRNYLDTKKIHDKLGRELSRRGLTPYRARAPSVFDTPPPYQV